MVVPEEVRPWPRDVDEVAASAIDDGLWLLTRHAELSGAICVLERLVEHGVAAAEDVDGIRTPRATTPRVEPAEAAL